MFILNQSLEINTLITTNKSDRHVQVFCMSVTGKFRNDAMLRQISEAVRINREGKKNVINSKSKWNCINVSDLAVE